jgi:exonuclease SbcD
MFRVLHTADLHLGRSFSSWGEAVADVRRRDLRRTFERIGELAVEQAVSLVIIAGDLFDVHHPDDSLVADVRGWLARLANNRIPVAIIPGNHDSYWYERSVYRDHRFPANTTVFTEATCTSPISVRINETDVYLYGIAHDHTRDRDPLRSFSRRGDNGLHIGILHGTVDPSPGFAVADRYLPLSSAQLASTGLNYVALGHIHRFRTFNDSSRGFAAQPGSPEPLALDETGPRSVSLVTIADGSVRIERQPVGVRHAAREQVDCDGLTHAEIVERLNRMADPACILDAVLIGAPDENIDVEAIEREVAAGFCYLSLSDRTEVVDSAFARSIEHEQTIRGRFVRTLRERARLAASDEERATTELALKRGLLALAKRSAS